MHRVPRETEQIMNSSFDIIVVGGGHAGAEAAAAAARLGSGVLLITMDMGKVAQMSCNPAIGGVAKGQIVREIDALGGLTGVVADRSMLQFRMLNRSKGAAMWSPRSQNDRWAFSNEWRMQLEAIPQLYLWQDMVTSLIFKDSKVVGVCTATGQQIFANAVVLTNGTFLNGRIHIGDISFGGGRSGDPASQGITEQLVGMGFDAGRMKTGTPPRVDGRSLDYSKMEVQEGDSLVSGFSFLHTQKPTKQKHCYIAYTNPEVHDILQTGFDKSPLFSGRIQGVGPRYCPSIEDKITRFSDKSRHQLFIEPEGWHTVEMYINGFSSSLPAEIQYQAMKKIAGFENVVFFRPGYAIEYDFFDPTQLQNTLETKIIENLYFAGQINGTTGYEEAACQGLMAGINAHRKINNLSPLILSRSDAYIGVLIDDLVTKGTNEPYRMFTSRAEYRILLRQDNADIRLTEIGHKIGLASDERMDKVRKKISSTEKIYKILHELSAIPEQINPYLESIGSAPLTQKTKLHNLLSRPGVQLQALQLAIPELNNQIQLESYAEEAAEQAEIAIKYAGYLNREVENAQKMLRLENIRLHTTIDYLNITSLSMEARQKLSHIRPETLGQASRISGVSPADISVLMVMMGR